MKPQALPIVVTGTAVAMAGLTGFLFVHAMAITPIWDRAASGVIQALIAGLTQAWAYETSPRRNGALFGLIMFTTLIPATVFSNALRIAGLPANDWPGFACSIGLSLASGAAAGRIVVGNRSGIVAYMTAALGLLIASAGPVPVANGVRPAWLFAGFVPICVVGGVVLSTVRARL